MAASFDHILDWRLLAGSHDFPGPDGGTCINEAAVVAAGLPYRAIRSSADCPPCFSPPLAAYALGLNDTMPDAERPRLMAFVLRLSGSADGADVEARRIAFLALEGIRRILPPLLDRAGFSDLAARCDDVRDLDAAVSAARAAEWRGGAAAQGDSERGEWRRGALASAVARAAAAAVRSAGDARCAADVAAAAAPFSPGTWTSAMTILDEALLIGRQAGDIDPLRARERLDAARIAGRIAAG
ncbi:hypothetical protein [Methylobacterium sp. Leaf466]|uniref:hypothetical protein n=1 Tax=Methylobacterium sp. Leaf466 TaxID=1736386 RepID=UPI0007004CC1|nr:hypothetical protein [Methylobacterium sp. Leaf466]KQT78486.1 hypothetical protein ASG59_08405 [Methylobacterium sp. Leaf466]